MNAIAVNEIVEHWDYVASALRAPANDAEYEQLVVLMNDLLDQGGADEDNPLSELVDLIGNIVSDYETEHFPMPDASGVECLRFLIDQHGLKYDDLRAEIGTKGVVADILNGRRQLNVRQISALTKRFGVSADVFIN
jgi:HTH-type transcriptional regulator/antitoxin HigA